MNLLMHICCAPCAIYPLRELRREGHQVTGFFYNPNIHPSQEYRKRLETLIEFAREEDLPLIQADNYEPEVFLRAVAFRESKRCGACYHLRIIETARRARREGFEGFTTTLLYSVYQDHALLKDMGETCSGEENSLFCYRDFREGWKEGVTLSRLAGMYRQQYCGCLYSEGERFYRPPPKA